MIRFILALVAAFSLAGVAGAKTVAKKEVKPAIQKITFTNKLVDGKKVWLPAEAKLNHEGALEITLINELDDPHGFNVPGLTKEALVVQGKETKTVSVEAKKGEYKFSCQMHPAHVGGSISVQ